METKEEDNVVLIRLFKDDDIMECLKMACEKHDIETAIIIMGIGQVKDIQLGYFRSKGDYVKQNFPQPYEIISLSGNVSLQKDGYNFHIHACLGDIVKKTIGGHLIDAKVTAMAEIGLMKTKIKIIRRQDPETGLMAMHFD